MKSGPLSRKGLKSWKRGCRNKHAAQICQYACVLKHIYRNNVRQHFESIGPALGEGPLIGRPAAGVLKVWPRRGAYPTVIGLRNSIRRSISLLRGIAVNAVTARAGDIIPIMWRAFGH